MRTYPFARALLVSCLALLALAAPAAAQTDQRCFAETGQCIAGPIRASWEQNGGLAVFGFPITPQGMSQVEGRTLQIQWFERDRLEIQADGSVTAGRLGAERLEQLGTPWQFGPSLPAGDGCLSFVETGHQVCGGFAQAWQQNGGATRFGFPITGEFTTEIEGRTLTVQYFERRRFELHEGNQVLLGLLGSEVFVGSGGQMPTPPPPAPTPAPIARSCADEPNPRTAPHTPVRITAINKRAETVTLRNVSGQPVDLSGWLMCSLTGNQRHPIGGVLAPGESRTFDGPRAYIWNNDDFDPGALYDAQGQFISSFPN